MIENNYYEDFINEDKELNEAFDALISFEVNRRLNKAIQDFEVKQKQYESAIEEAKTLKDELYEKEAELEKSDKTFSERGYREAKREFLNGFYIGDKVWFIMSQYVREDCKTCENKGIVRALFDGDLVDVNCPKCKGRKFLSHTKRWVDSGLVRELKVHHWAKGRQTSTEAWLEHNNDSINVKNFFKTKEEAQAYLDKED